MAVGASLLLLLLPSLLVTAGAAGVPTVELRNGVKMPMLAAGSWQYNSSQAAASISAALSSGFTMVDTALDYHNQDGVGRALAAVPRESVFVETKVPGCLLDPTTLNPFNCYGDTKKNLETNLRLLNLSYVDLVIVHFPPLPSLLLRTCSRDLGQCELIKQQWKAMEEFYEGGKARAIGVSNYCESCFDCLREADVFPMVNQVQYHLGMGADPKRFFSFGKAHGVVVQAYSVLGNFDLTRQASSAILTSNVTKAIARAHGKSPVQVALKWVVSQGVPAVTKSANPLHLAADLDLWSWDLTPAQLDLLNAQTSPAGSPSFACSSAEEAAQTATFI